MDSYYIIKNELNKYYVNIHKNKKKYNILVGGIKKKCVNFTMYNDDEIGVLELLENDSRCFLFQDTNNSDIIDLLRTSLYFMYVKFPTLKYIEFSDNSFITCKNNKRMSLPDLMTVKSGKTWYEYHFNAIPYNNEYILLLKNIIKELKNKKIELSTEEFINKHYATYRLKNGNTNKNIKIKKHIIEKTKEKYRQNITFKEYLDIFIDYDCIYYENIFNNIIGQPLQNTKWLININIIKKYNVTLKMTKIDKIQQNDDLNKLSKNLRRNNKNKLAKLGGCLYHGYYKE